jgi:hypothetical protein
MKNIGVVMIAIGLALMIFVAYNFVKGSNQLKSPIPEEKGVKVIFVTPSSK